MFVGNSDDVVCAGDGTVDRPVANPGVDAIAATSTSIDLRNTLTPLQGWRRERPSRGFEPRGRRNGVTDALPRHAHLGPRVKLGIAAAGRFASAAAHPLSPR